MSPSGKAHGFGPCIQGFESLHPSHEVITDTEEFELRALFVFTSVVIVRIPSLVLPKAI